MKLEMRLKPGDDVRTVWLFVLCILLGGSYYIQTRYQSAITASYERTEKLYRNTVADARIVREAGTLRRIEVSARADLARVSHDTSLARSTVDLLKTLQDAGKRFDAQVTEVTPGGEAASAAAPLSATGLTIRLRGKFRNILGFVEDLSHHATLIRVADTELTVANGEGQTGEPRLDATVHATLYRLNLPREKERRIASAR